MSNLFSDGITFFSSFWKNATNQERKFGGCCLLTAIANNKSLFSLVPRLSTRHCPHLPLSAVAYYRSISPARGALSSKPAARRCCCRSMGQTDGRTLDRFIRPCSTYCAGSVNNRQCGDHSDMVLA